MNIVIYIASAGKKRPDAAGLFVSELLLPLLAHFTSGGSGETEQGTVRQPGLHKITIVTDGLHPLPVLPAGIVIHRRPAGGIAAAWWKLTGWKKILRSSRPERLLGINVVPPVKGIPAYTWFEEEVMLTGKTVAAQLRNSSGVFVATPAVASGLALLRGLGQLRIIPVRRPARQSFVPVDENEKESTRMVHTGGRSYFLYSGVLDAGLMELIKAFSVFKKRQKSDWRLVLAGDTTGSDPKFVASLAHYRYKSDLVLMDPADPAALPAIAGAAYAALFKPGQDALLPEMMAAGVPSLVPHEALFHGSSDEALLFYAPGSQIDLAENMMTIYKDESLRARKVAAGLKQAAGARWQELAAQVAAALLK